MPKNKLSFNFLKNIGDLRVLKRAFFVKWNRAVRRAVPIIDSRFRSSLIRGGDPLIPGFTTTDAWKWITSPEGFGQLGFRNRNEPEQLLRALEQSVRVFIEKNPNGGDSINITFGDLTFISQLTTHPASNQSVGLRGVSWFVDWIILDRPVTDRGFVDIQRFQKSTNRGSLPRSFRIAGLSSGFMLPGRFAGSTGTWKVPGFLRPSVEAWADRIRRNIPIMINREIRRLTR